MRIVCSGFFSCAFFWLSVVVIVVARAVSGANKYNIFRVLPHFIIFFLYVVHRSFF